MIRKMKCLILAAGYATRLYPLTENFPKPLLTIKGKPIIDWLIDDIDSCGVIDEFVVISNHKFIAHFSEWVFQKQMATKMTVLDDGSITNENRRGAVADIQFALESLAIEDDVMVIAGDNVLDFSLKTFVDYFSQKRHTCIMRYYEAQKEKIKKSASVTFAKDDLVLKMVEKPKFPDSNWCVPPFYIYTKEDSQKVKIALKNGCNKDAPGSYIHWLYDKSKIYAMEMPGKRYDVGTLEGYRAIDENYRGIVNRQD